MLTCVCTPADTRLFAARAKTHGKTHNKDAQRRTTHDVASTRVPIAVTQLPATVATPTPTPPPRLSQQTPSSPSPRVSLAELQEMATRQHYQIVAEEKRLSARAQRVQQLREQDARSGVQLGDEERRLRALKECVARQEDKLRQLRAAKQRVDANRVDNAALESAAAAVRGKAVATQRDLEATSSRLDAVTRLLQDLRVQRCAAGVSAIVQERDQLRRQLAAAAHTIDAQQRRVTQQRAGVAQRLAVLRDVTSRVEQLEERLVRRRALNAKNMADNEAALRRRLESTNSPPTHAPRPRHEEKPGHSYCQVAIQGKQSSSPTVQQQIQLLQRSGVPAPVPQNVGRRAEGADAFAAPAEQHPFKARSHQKATSCTYLKPTAPTKVSQDAKILAMTGNGKKSGSICSVLLSYDESPSGRTVFDSSRQEDHPTRFYRRRLDGDNGNAKPNNCRNSNLASKGSFNLKQQRVVDRTTCYLSEETRKSVAMKIKNIRNNNNSLGFAPDVIARQ